MLEICLLDVLLLAIPVAFFMLIVAVLVSSKSLKESGYSASIENCESCGFSTFEKTLNKQCLC